jgi:hypothetical protein
MLDHKCDDGGAFHINAASAQLMKRGLGLVTMTGDGKKQDKTLWDGVLWREKVRISGNLFVMHNIF